MRRGLTAGTFQHEVDHLDGMLFVDRVGDPSDVHHLGAVRAPPPRRVRGAAHASSSSASARDRAVVRARLARRRPSARPGCCVEIEGGPDRVAFEQASRRGAGAERLRGLTLPGSPTRTATPSTARCAAARSGPGSFWTWREQMYALAARSTPTATSPSPARRSPRWRSPGSPSSASSTTCTTRPAATPYDDPNAMGRALIAAAGEAGIRLTLLDACYLHGGSARFRDASAEAWAERVGAARRRAARVGAAIHSVRAVDPAAARGRRRLGGGARRPLHAHVSEQPAENEFACPELRHDADRAARRGRRAERALHRRPRDPSDATTTSPCSAARGATVCLCPTTERDLADGIGPAARSLDAGARLALGSDSHAVIDLLRGGARDRARRAPGHRRARPSHGRRAAGGGDGRRLREPRLARRRADRGRRARRPDRRSRSTACGSPARRRSTATVVLRRRAADVSDVMVGGRWIVRDGAHVSIDVAARAARGAARRMSRRLVDRQHRPARHQRPGARRRPARVVRDAALVIDGRARRRHRAGGRGAGDERDRRRRALRDPRLRRQPHPPRLRRRPRRRVRRSHGRRALRGRRHPRHHRRHARRDRRAAARARRARAAARRCAAGHHARRDQVRLRPRRRHRARALRSPPSSPTTSRSSARTSCRRSSRGAPTTTSSSSAARCSTPARRTRAGSTCSARTGAFDADQSRAVLEAGRAAGLVCASTPTSSATARASSSRSSSAARRPTTARTSPTTTRRARRRATRSPRSCRRPTSRPASPIPTRAA